MNRSYNHLTVRAHICMRSDFLNPQSVGSIVNKVFLSSLIGFIFQFESQRSRFYWKNLCLSIRAEIFNLNCGTDLKMSPTDETFPKIFFGQKKEETFW